MKVLAKFSFFFVTVCACLIWFVGEAAAADCYLQEGVYVCDTSLPQPTFVAPEPLANSFLPRVMYVKLADFANVYAGPSSGSGLVRNVGDGFLFSTVQAVVENEGQTWYMINFDEYVQASEARIVEDSEFTGFEIKNRPERPFGWMIVDYWYSDAPGAEPTPGNLKLPRYTFFEVFAAVEADDGWIWYDIGNGRWMRQTYVALVDPTTRPEGVGSNEYWVEVDLYEQSFAAYEGDRMVYAGLVSSGLNRWPTHEGLFQVWDRHLRIKMSGAEGKVDYYFVEDVPHTMFFNNDIALHGAYWHDRFGYKHSHGCVNMPPRDAEWVYNWSADAHNDLWVWVHTSDPTTIFTEWAVPSS